MEFESNFLFLVGVFGYLIWMINFFKLFKKPELILPKSVPLKKRSYSRFFVFALSSTGWLLLTLSLMNPKTKKKTILKKEMINDIVFVLDVSRSMLAMDYKPNRLSLAKKTIKEFIDLNPNERYGVILFSEKIYTHTPLTSDSNYLSNKIKTINGDDLGSGTNIGDALILAAGRFSYSKAKNKYVILLTDGVSNVGSVTPIEAGKRLMDQRIKLFSIGIGKDQDAKIPVNPANPFLGGFQKIPGGSIDFDTLKTISNMTLGSFFSVSNGMALRQILKKIGTDENIKSELRRINIYEHNYFIFLLLGIFFLFSGELIRVGFIKEEL